jgi:hypothetical protein
MIGAGKAVTAKLRVPLAYFRQSVLRALLNTPPAVDAKMVFEGDLGFRLPGFNVLAPGTAQGAALEKNQAPYSRTVMKTEMLQGKDEGFSRAHGSSAQ